MFFKKLLTITIPVLAVCALSLSGLVTASAQSETQKGLIVAPAIHEVEGDRGGSYEITVGISNDTDTEVTLFPFVQTFQNGEDEGMPVVTPIPAGSSLNGWVLFKDSAITLKGGEKKDSKVDVRIPSEAAPGSYYFALTYASQDLNARKEQTSTDEQKKVSINMEISALLFVTVKGQVTRDVVIDSLSTNRGIVDPMFDQLALTYRIALKGNAYYKPAGDMFFGSEAGRLPLNPNQRIILPDSSRTFNKILDPSITNSPLSSSVDQNALRGEVRSYSTTDTERPFIGQQTVTVKALYVDSTGTLQVATRDVTVTYFPWRLALAIVAVAGIAVAVWLYIRSRKSTSSQN